MQQQISVAEHQLGRLDLETSRESPVPSRDLSRGSGDFSYLRSHSLGPPLLPGGPNIISTLSQWTQVKRGEEDVELRMAVEAWMRSAGSAVLIRWAALQKAPNKTF